MRNSNRLFDQNSLLAASITRAASLQTYATIRFLVDRERVAGAFRAYAYFRWLDDRLDQDGLAREDRLALVERQSRLVRACYAVEDPGQVCEEESLLVDLLRKDSSPGPGLRSYVDHMLAVMAFDAERRGRLITRAELMGYTDHLAVAVTEAMHYFIGHNCKAPGGDLRYQAVRAAHITHMLRDTLDDVRAGYFNIPRETLEELGIGPGEVWSVGYRQWVRGRVEQARAYFERGRECLARVESLRCRLAGFAYAARFESVLSAIEKDGFRLRPAYPECEAPSARLAMISSAFSNACLTRLAMPRSLSTR